MSSPQEWYSSLPPVSRVWITAAIVTALAGRFAVLDPRLLAFNWPLIWEKFHIWRLPLNFLFFGTPSFPWLINMIMLGRYAPALEDNPYPSGGGAHRGNIADFVYMLLFGAIVLLFAGWWMGMYFMSFSLFFMVIYVWSRRHPEEFTSFYGFRFKASYLPWVLVGFSFIVGDDPIRDILGIAAGHLYYFLQEVLPTADTPLKGYKLLQTPQWLYNLLHVAPTDRPAAFIRLQPGANLNAAPAQQPAQRLWGQGRVLGRRDE